MTTPLEQILLDAELDDLLERLDAFRNHIRSHVPAEILITSAGEYNVRNRYGAIMLHIALLTSILKPLQE